MSAKYLFPMLIALALFLASCASTPTPPPDQVNRPPVPTPNASSGTVTGQVLANSTKAPIGQTPIYLAQIHWDDEHKSAAYVLNISQSPAALTDQNGFFTFTTVPPNEYALIVGQYDGNNDVVRESNGDARIYRIEAGKAIDAGAVEVNPIVEKKTP